VFFIGLLSTPLPYLLLAGFYFFGFAMGMFQNSTEDQTLEPIASITIEHEVAPSMDNHSTFHYLGDTNKIQTQSKSLPSDECILPLFSDSGIIQILQKDTGIQKSLFSKSRFSRPPPSFC